MFSDDFQLLLVGLENSRRPKNYPLLNGGRVEVDKTLRLTEMNFQ